MQLQVQPQLYFLRGTQLWRSRPYDVTALEQQRALDIDGVFEAPISISRIPTNFRWTMVRVPGKTMTSVADWKVHVERAYFIQMAFQLHAKFLSRASEASLRENMCERCYSDQDEPLKVFVDGSFVHTPTWQTFGCGAIFLMNETECDSSGRTATNGNTMRWENFCTRLQPVYLATMQDSARSARAELGAVVLACYLAATRFHRPISIHCDNKSVIQSVNCLRLSPTGQSSLRTIDTALMDTLCLMLERQPGLINDIKWVKPHQTDKQNAEAIGDIKADAAAEAGRLRQDINGEFIELPILSNASIHPGAKWHNFVETNGCAL